MKDSESRRRVLGYAVATILAAIGTALATILGVSVAAPSFVRRQRQWVELGKIDDLTTRPKRFDLVRKQRQGWLEEERRQAVYAYRNEKAEVVVLSSTCTHLGCIVRWEGASKQFQCPCHGGAYDSSGKVISGPPPRPLMRLETHLEKDRIQVQET
ncbi:MAG: ubiquinol-cytochrome c reductase iron-sulfur subunit [Acidobacteriota bacterium]